ncbi:MAG: hypothetical protein GEV08_19420 [Acidimicrobiia bacterium]|nr:hypothetical protein [Acidimicrobiia bacterium]
MELFGRARELGELVDRLRGHRLVTVMGPGGIGKTALARAASARLAHTFELGAHEVDLTRVDAPGAVGGAMASQLGFPTFSALVSSPSEQPALLVVDNCEHVLDAAAVSIAELLAACQSPTVVATSRSPLDVPGESLVVLGPLELPTAGHVDRDIPSMALFLERARDAGVAIEEDELEAVADLCRRLDGVPLALEIAAARIRSMTPAEVLARLGDLDTLSRPRFRGSARHRSVRATIEWSYALLGERERDLFDRLGVCSGSFRAVTAQALDVGAATPADTFQALDSLVAASLLVAHRQGSTTRYRQLETVRAFALGRLDARGELTPTWDRFVEHVLGQVLGIIDAATTGWRSSVLAELFDLFDDVAAALRWCVANDPGPSRAVLLLAVLWGVVHQAHAEDVGALGEQVLARWPEPTVPYWADAAATLATCRYLAGSLDEASALATRALEVGGVSFAAPVTLRRALGQARRARGDAAGALALFVEGTEEARAEGLTGMALELDVARATVLADLGQVDVALDLVRSAALEASTGGSDINEVWARTTEGYILLRSDPRMALEVVDAAMAAARRIGYAAGVFANMRSRALGELGEGRPQDAARTMADLLDELVSRGGLELRLVLDTVAVVLERVGRPSWASLAATSHTLPVVSLLASVRHELFPLPAHDGPVLGIGEAVSLARAELAAFLEAVSVAALPVPAGRAAPLEPATDAVAPAEGAAEDGVFALVGELWQVGFAGRTVLVKPSKGMADLARLLAAPDREVHCMELVGVVVEEHTTGEVIDAAARRQYEQRARDLQAEVDDAAADHDLGRAERARVELDLLVDHLAAALGLGGQVRRTGSNAERARSAVTQRVRGTIRRISKVHPELGRHLSTSIATGTFCCYRPERATRWRT